MRQIELAMKLKGLQSQTKHMTKAHVFFENTHNKHLIYGEF